MRAELQGDFVLRRTENFFDQVIGNSYHLQPITFHEFLSKPESLFMYDNSFMQIPGYIQKSAEIDEIEEDARQYVAQFIMDEFEHKILGMQDYVRWATLFEHKCAAITPSFWAQVNMHDLMLAKELEMDENNSTRTNTGNAMRLGGQTTTTDQSSNSKTQGITSTNQDITNSQTTDGTTREATATVVRAGDQISDGLNYNWNDAADNIHEVRNRAGDTNQHLESSIDSNQETETASNSVSTVSMNNMSDETTTTGIDKTEYTNKMFMQEKQWAINTAQLLMPLEWLKQQLRPMFYMIY